MGLPLRDCTGLCVSSGQLIEYQHELSQHLRGEMRLSVVLLFLKYYPADHRWEFWNNKNSDYVPFSNWHVSKSLILR